ncbi:MAG TPA: TIGR00730 family Rossman fold protein [Dehalococcoidia bacterium]|nr:TIGR00730 family Rossman fold protein [Dehalococcoidia bacterium]
MKSIEDLDGAAVAEAPKRRLYRTGRPDLDEAIAKLVELADVSEPELVSEMLTSVVRYSAEGADRGELKLVNRALKELRYARRVFAPYRDRRKVTIFGSARTQASEPGYVVAREFAAEITSRGWMVITGAGGGIMEAGIEGAGRKNSFGLHIDLPFEPQPSPALRNDPKLINFRYFFTRKVTFVKESDGFVLVPGGFGTLDETFELLTLLQTGRADMHPVVLLERGGVYWKELHAFLVEHLCERGMVDEDDLKLVRVAETVSEAADIIESFYDNYQSERYIRGRLVYRMKRLPPAEDLARLSQQFSDMLASGGFDVVEPSDEEHEDDDFLDLQRIAFDYNRHSAGRLRQLIDELNRY